MARKNLIGFSSSENQDKPKIDTAPSFTASRPIAGFTPTTRTGGPVGGITKSLGNITEKMKRAQDLERQLAEGHVVIEIEPSLIDGSFINDRLSINAADLGQLAEQIRDHGQQVPILVRPHPKTNGRYQVAYGHRRLAAVKQLGIKVRAVVSQLTDEQLVVSQGQENNTRTNLSYIERSLFAAKLEERAFTRDIIMSALGIDKTNLSRMINLVKQIPFDLIELIGPAPEVGRRRWMEFAEKLTQTDYARLLVSLADKDMLVLTSDEKFQMVVDTMKPGKSEPSAVMTQLKNIPVTVKKSKTGATFVFDVRNAPGFDDFVRGKLGALFAEYKKQAGD